MFLTWFVPLELPLVRRLKWKASKINATSENQREKESQWRKREEKKKDSREASKTFVIVLTTLSRKLLM